MGLLKDNFERGLLVVHSRWLLDEMKSIVRDDGSIQAEGRGKDDRVIAGALGVKAYNDQLRLSLIARNVIWKPAEDTPPAPPQSLLGRSVQNYLQATGVIPKPRPQNLGVRAYLPPVR